MEDSDDKEYIDPTITGYFDIKTAPKNVIILGYDPLWYEMWIPMHWNRGKWKFWHNDEDAHPTHWIPIPLVPGKIDR